MVRTEEVEKERRFWLTAGRTQEVRKQGRGQHARDEDRACKSTEPEEGLLAGENSAPHRGICGAEIKVWSQE